MKVKWKFIHLTKQEDRRVRFWNVWHKTPIDQHSLVVLAMVQSLKAYHHLILKNVFYLKACMVYRTTHLPIAFCGCLTWSVTLRRLGVFENRVLRKILGSKAAEVTDNVHHLHVQHPFTYEKPEAANAVLGPWWWAVCHPKHVELHINME